MTSLIRATFASFLILGPVIPACAQSSLPASVGATHPPKQKQVVARRTPPPVYRAPTRIVFPTSNGITTRKVFLWAHPAKIEPHIREVPNGRPVQVVGSQGGFYAVIMHDGLRGWLPNDAVRPR